MCNTTSHKTLRILIFSAVFLNSCGSSIVLDTPQSPIYTETVLPTTEAQPTDQPAIPFTEIASSLIGFDFEIDAGGWHTSEAPYKLADASVTTTTAYTGSQSLQITTELFGNQSAEFAQKNNDQVYLHTEATGYFDSSVPEGIDGPGPYDLEGNRVSCFIYIPLGLVANDNPPVYVRIFVKDGKFANQFAEAVDITEDNAEQWFELSLIVDDGEGADAQFDPTQVNALGVRFDVSWGSNLSYTGPVYIDSCTIEYP
jgi:hypothetical protein